MEDFLVVVVAVATAPLFQWLALVAVLVGLGWLGVLVLRSPYTYVEEHPAPDEPYDWKRHGL